MMPMLLFQTKMLFKRKAKIIIQIQKQKIVRFIMNISPNWKKKNPHSYKLLLIQIYQSDQPYKLPILKKINPNQVYLKFPLESKIILYLLLLFLIEKVNPITTTFNPANPNHMVEVINLSNFATRVILFSLFC